MRRRPANDLVSLRGVKRAAERIPDLFNELIELLALIGETERFETVFSDVADKVPPVDWVRSLFDHHTFM